MTGGVLPVPPALRRLAEAALARLRRNGSAHQEAGSVTWQVDVEEPETGRLHMQCRGPALPAVPAQMASAERIATEQPWQGAYRLTVTAPLVVLDLCWSDDQPLRILTFSRGTWERSLLS
jgi:hypothetical protein